MQPEHPNAAYPLHPVGLTTPQLQCLQRALEHELHRTNARARDERLGDETRQAEHDALREMRGLLDRLRRLAPR